MHARPLCRVSVGGSWARGTTSGRPASDELLAPQATPADRRTVQRGDRRTADAGVALARCRSWRHRRRRRRLSASAILPSSASARRRAVSHYAPADAAMYEEIDLNMPGDQHDQLASFMSHFPGFADPSSFQQKLDDTLNQLLGVERLGLDLGPGRRAVVRQPGGRLRQSLGGRPRPSDAGHRHGRRRADTWSRCR